MRYEGQQEIYRYIVSKYMCSRRHIFFSSCVQVVLMVFSSVLELANEISDIVMLPTYMRDDRPVFFLSLFSIVLSLLLRVAECVQYKRKGLIQPSNTSRFLGASCLYILEPHAGLVALKGILQSSKMIEAKSAKTFSKIQNMIHASDNFW